MRSLTRSRVPNVRIAVVLALALVMSSTAAVAAKKPAPSPPPPAPAPSASVEIAPSGTLEPDHVYANVDVTAACPVGWTFTNGWLNLLQNGRGGGGTFSVSCTGMPQVVHVRAVNGNRFQLGDWTASAHLVIQRNGQQVTATSSRTIRLVPGPTVRIAPQGQLTGTTGGGVQIAVAVACPMGATGQESSVTVSQDGTALGRATFTPICDRQTRTVVLSITASQGTFHTGSAVADAMVSVGWNGESFTGADHRAVSLLESSTGDTTPPTMPAGLSASTFGDTETWLTWGASTDNATPTGLIFSEVYLNGRFDQGIGGGQTQAILYSDFGVLNTIEVVAIDGAGNRSAPASVTVDMRP